MPESTRELLRELLEIHRELFGLYRDDGEGPAKWLSAPLDAFGGETPLRHMLRNRQGIRDVLEYLRSFNDHP